MSEHFHEQLLLFFQEDLRKRKLEEGWDDRFDHELRIFSDELSKALRGISSFSLQQLIEKRIYLLSTRPMHLEHQILQIFPDLLMQKLNLPFLRVVRGLPRLYQKKNPSCSKLNPAVQEFSNLKKKITLRFLCHLYDQIPVPKNASVQILGENWLAALATKVLKEEIPYLELIAQDEAQKKADLSITFSDKSIKIGTEEHALGFHFLDRGIFLPKTLSREVKSGFYVADLKTASGTFFYLHTLFKILEEDSQDLEICILNPEVVIEYFDQQMKKEEFFVKNYNIKSFEVEINGYFSTKQVAAKGKKVRIFSPLTELSWLQIQDLFAQSANLVACGCSATLSLAIAQDKLFFYDGEVEFIKNLLALIENQFPSQQKIIEFFRVMLNLSALQNSLDDEEWIDELNLQKEEPLNFEQITETIGDMLKNPAVCREFSRFNQLIKENYSANEFFVQAVQRGIVHNRRPKLAEKEDEFFKQFIKNEISFQNLIESMREILL